MNNNLMQVVFVGDIYYNLIGFFVSNVFRQLLFFLVDLCGVQFCVGINVMFIGVFVDFVF